MPNLLLSDVFAPLQLAITPRSVSPVSQVYPSDRTAVGEAIDGLAAGFEKSQLKNGHLEVVQFLVGAGADKEKAVQDGATPLFIAADQGQLDVVPSFNQRSSLLGLGADQAQELLASVGRDGSSSFSLSEVCWGGAGKAACWVPGTGSNLQVWDSRVW